ncbi:MAG: glycosyltransferase, partial [Actinomycetota bacterium]
LEAIDAGPAFGRPRLVLGLRDIYGEAGWTMQDWRRLGAHEVLPIYDLVLVFGDPAVTTTAQEIGLHEELGGKLEHTGYLGQHLARSRKNDRGEPPPILVTAGGGYDGAMFLEQFVEFLERRGKQRRFRARILTGPFLSRSQLRSLKQRCSGLGPVEVTAYTRRMERMLSEAAGVVCMAGYNSMVEVISAQVPALVVPRISPSQEQVIRAQRLSEPGGLRWCIPGPGALSSIDALVDEVADDAPRKNESSVDLGGISRSVKLIQSLL